MKRKKGISLISLIITIIVIIILAAIVIFSGLNTPDRANFAKFAQSFSDYNTAIMGDYSKKKTKYAVGGDTRTDAQIYYIIATGNENIVDVNDAPTPVAKVEELGLPLHPEGLNGTEYYQITSDSNIDGINKQMQFYEAGEKHYVTDKGEAFMLPGYLVSENGTNRWYINERKYYESDEAIMGPLNFEISEEKLYTDSSMTEEVSGTLEKGTDKAYIHFTANVNGEAATISPEVPYEITDNGEYTFTITANVDGAEKTMTKIVNISGTFLQATDPSLFTRNSGKITGLTEAGKAKEEIVIPKKMNGVNITGIARKAFKDCTNLKSITIPMGVTVIEYEAFRGCTNLENVVISSSVETIMENAFKECTNLKEIIIPEGVKNINYGTFEGCSSLTNVTIPSSVEAIKGQAFFYCSNLTNITLPQGLTSIETYAFANCNSLTNVIIPSSVTSIGSNAFSRCSNLQSIELSANLTTIESSLFILCSKLESITIPGKVTTINSQSFQNCTRITSVTIPLSVTIIAATAYTGCNSLTDLYYEGTQEQWNAIQKGSLNLYIPNATIHYNSTGPTT